MAPDTEFGAAASLSVEVDQRSLTKVRGEIEDEIGDVSVGIEGSRSAIADGGSAAGAIDGAGMIAELGDQTDILEDIRDELEAGAVGGGAGGGGGGGGTGAIGNYLQFRGLEGLLGRAGGKLPSLSGLAGPAAAAGVVGASGLATLGGAAAAGGAWMQPTGEMTGGGTVPTDLEHQEGTEPLEPIGSDGPTGVPSTPGTGDWGDEAVQDILDNSDLEREDLDESLGGEGKGGFPESLSGSREWQDIVEMYEESPEPPVGSEWEQIFKEWQSATKATEEVEAEQLDRTLDKWNTLTDDIESMEMPDYPEPEWIDSATHASSGEDGQSKDESMDLSTFAGGAAGGVSDALNTVTGDVSGDATDALSKFVGGAAGGATAADGATGGDADKPDIAGPPGAGEAGSQILDRASNRAAENQQRRGRMEVNVTNDLSLDGLSRELEKMKRTLQRDIERKLRREINRGR
ncbi:MAG: hypothetical protein ACOCUA_02625 [archaeon]